MEGPAYDDMLEEKRRKKELESLHKKIEKLEQRLKHAEIIVEHEFGSDLSTVIQWKLDRG